MPVSDMSYAQEAIGAARCQDAAQRNVTRLFRWVNGVSSRDTKGSWMASRYFDEEIAKKKNRSAKKFGFLRKKKCLHLCRVSHPSGTRYVNGCLSDGLRIPLQSHRRALRTGLRAPPELKLRLPKRVSVGSPKAHDHHEHRRGECIILDRQRQAKRNHIA